MFFAFLSLVAGVISRAQTASVESPDKDAVVSMLPFIVAEGKYVGYRFHIKASRRDPVSGEPIIDQLSVKDVVLDSVPGRAGFRDGFEIKTIQGVPVEGQDYESLVKKILEAIRIQKSPHILRFSVIDHKISADSRSIFGSAKLLRKTISRAMVLLRSKARSVARPPINLGGFFIADKPQIVSRENNGKRIREYSNAIGVPKYEVSEQEQVARYAHVPESARNHGVAGFARGYYLQNPASGK